MKPAWHYRPEKNWINDPNGLVHHKGWYHMFYQYNPGGDQWGDIHWGHARSRDLLAWETLPVALAPDHGKGELHCFSGGCCKDENGVPHFFYTSVGAAEDGRDCVHGAQQWFAEAAVDDLLHLVQTDEGALTDDIHGGSPAGSGMHVRDWRDPCVLRHEGQYLMVLGGCVQERGCVLLYTSPDMRTWTYRHILAQSDKEDGVPWECPNLFRVDGKFGLIYSPCSAVRVKLGTLDAELVFHEDADELLEPERNGFYAPQVFTDEGGRVIVIGWMPEADNVPHKGWSGVMSLPRVLRLTEDGLTMTPVPGAELLPGVKRFSVARQELPMTCILHNNGTERTALTLFEDGLLALDRSESTLADTPDRHPVTRRVPVKDVNDMFIAVDGSAVECAVNGKWLSARIYPTK
ncbi:MAG: glycoside hydrolase family 32 protein [Clostridia bacterium]|nr:glycoside hydrolase family 32 protein [Clostridia bacterium]